MPHQVLNIFLLACTVGRLVEMPVLSDCKRLQVTLKRSKLGTINKGRLTKEGSYLIANRAVEEALHWVMVILLDSTVIINPLSRFLGRRTLI